MHSCHPVKWRASQSAYPCELDYNWGSVYRAEYLLECAGNDGSNVGTSQRLCWVSQMFTKKQKEHHLQVCQDLPNHTKLKAAASWIASLPVMRCGFSTMSWSQNSNMWSSDMWILHGRKCLQHSPQHVKWCVLSFGIVKWWSFWISCNSDKPSALTTTLWHWLRWRLEILESALS